MEPIKVEAIKIAYKQVKEGNIISFRIHPDDLDHALAIIPLGTICELSVNAPDSGNEAGVVEEREDA